MKAVHTELLELLGQSGRRFVVPIYQRVYSWDFEQCDELLSDILSTGERSDGYQHFTGSIVYIASDEGTRTSREPDLLIDGQQRVTTVTILLAALVALLRTFPQDKQELVGGFSPDDIQDYYLTNRRKNGDEFFKLVLSQRDKDALKAVVIGAPLPDSDSRVLSNYAHFVERLSRLSEEQLSNLCRGLSRLIVVDVELARGKDDPQRVFESMNATGKGLSQADLIRNFVLMDLPTIQQERLYEDYWYPMELLFTGNPRQSFDSFARHYITMKTSKIPKQGSIYDAFKEYVFRLSSEGTSRELIVQDLHRHAKWFAAIAFGQDPDPVLAAKFADVDQNVSYPFLLRLYTDYDAQLLAREDFIQILDAINSYLFRRAVCDIATNSLNTTFVTLLNAIEPSDYAQSILVRLSNFGDRRRFPTDEEFKKALTERDLYHFKRIRHLFNKLENFGRKEYASIAEYSIEHIMPQNANAAWQNDLGENWQEIHNWYLHTLGNLTLTGYNPEYSDRPFHQKRDMDGGFKESPLFLNRGIGSLDSWNQDSMEERGLRLAEQALVIWSRPKVSEQRKSAFLEDEYQGKGFDWTALHQILSTMPVGTWTSYANLAEVVGTGAQALSTHLRNHLSCINAYRVLTWDGRIAEGFRWSDPNEDRDVVDVLTAEGIEFVDSQASRSTQLQPEDLRALLDDEAELLA